MSEISPVKLSHTIPVSRELAIAYGLIDPTEAERQQIEEHRAAAQAWQARRDERHADAVASLRQHGPLINALLDLHAADDHGECQGCDFDGAEAERPQWPCRTVDLLAEHHGIQIEELR